MELVSEPGVGASVTNYFRTEAGEERKKTYLAAWIQIINHAEQSSSAVLPKEKEET